MFCALLRTPRGGEWWRAAKTVGFYPAFAADVDAMLARNEPAATALIPVPTLPDGTGSETLT